MEEVFAKIADLMLAVSEMSVELNDAKERSIGMDDAWRDAANLITKRDEEIAGLKEAYSNLQEQYKNLAEERNALRAQYASLKSKCGE